MKIDILKKGIFTLPGHTLLDVISADHSPLDLLVREGIQNSMDASRDVQGHKFARVEFLTGTFLSGTFAALLEGVSESLQKHMFLPQSSYSYIAIKDFNTCGLNGPISVQHSREMKQSAGTLINLIYSIGYNQEATGAGGSWGFGKTTYFKMGIGLVVFYSRVRENSQYCSRLAVVLVEDARKKLTLLPRETHSLGVAFWGNPNEYDANATQPLTDEAQIADVLRIFKISPYIGEDTGTTVIMPYIKPDPLVYRSYVNYISDGKPYFACSVDEYLKTAIARWYAPRLNNPEYPYGKYLRACVNGRVVEFDQLPPVYSILNKLYKYSFCQDNECKNAELPYFIKAINLKRNQISATNREGGKLVYLKLNREQLGMMRPDNYLSPYTYIGKPLEMENVPIVCYVRKPGMIVGFDVNGEWSHTSQIECNANEYIIGMFVLDSNKTIATGISLDEYIRASEEADHSLWKRNPCRAGITDLNIVPRIQSEVKKMLNETFGVNIKLNDTQSTGLAHEFAWLLPSDSFGKEPTISPTQNDGSVGTNGGRKKTTVSPIVTIKEYKTETIVVEYKVFQPKACIQLMISCEDGDKDVSSWEKEMGTPFPFSIVPAGNMSYLDVVACTPGKEGKTIICALELDNDMKTAETLTVKKLKSSKNVFFGIDIQFAGALNGGEISGIFEIPKGMGYFSCSVVIE